MFNYNDPALIHWTCVWQLSGSFHAIVRLSSGCRQVVVRLSSGCRQAIVRQSADLVLEFEKWNWNLVKRIKIGVQCSTQNLLSYLSESISFDFTLSYSNFNEQSKLSKSKEMLTAQCSSM